MRLFNKSFKRYLVKLLVITVSMLLLATPLVWLQFSHPQQIHALSYILAQHSNFFTLFRWSLIGIGFALWPKFIHHRAKSQNWGNEKLNFWLAQRVRIFGWLIIFELIVCENLLTTSFKLL